MQAREIMTENPACVTPNDSIRTAAQEMLQCGCGLLPVVDNSQNKRLLGVITDRDIVCRVIAVGKDCGNSTVQDAMSSGKMWMAKPDDSVDRIIEMMEQGMVRRIPVVDENQRVLGIVAMADIAQEMEEDKVAEVIVEVSQPTGMPHA